jgi:hypothetical protein
MSARTLRLFLGILLAASSGVLKAQTIINDGGTHTVNGPSGPIFVENGSTLNVGPSASISGGAATSPLGYTASVFVDASSTINLNGGQIFAPQAPSPPAGNISGMGILDDGSFTASGGLVEGGIGIGASQQGGGFGLLLNGPVQISGGTFQGGAGFFGGLGAVMVDGNNVAITGGTFAGGTSTYSVTTGGAALLIQSSDIHSGPASITGGEFTGGPGAGVQGESLIFFGDGARVLNVSGGLFSGGVELGLFYGDSLNFFGQGFHLQDIAGTDWLSGTLADGTAFDEPILSGNGPYTTLLRQSGVEEEFSFQGIQLYPDSSVPEPSSWLLLTFGATGLAIARRRSDRSR